VEPSDEDCHTAIEGFITKKYGEVGKKLHTGRSRNDQSLTMVRLYCKDQVEKVKEATERVAAAFAARAAVADAQTRMPGYTHMQRAMPTTVARWLGSFADAFKDAAPLADALRTLLDQNPLGSAAGFGIANLKLDRTTTTRELGFAKTQANPLYCGLSRGLFESTVLASLSHVSVLCSRFAVDMMMFTQQETAFFSLSDAFVTGSSIMPQKKNYDVFEIMRAQGKVYASYASQVQNIIQTLGSGYHRDLQLTKKALICAFDVLLECLSVLELAVPAIAVHTEKLEAAMGEELYVTEKVYERVANGESFRDAYGKVKAEFFAKTRAKPY
jgi:argininosuccinate lyase